MFSLILMKVVKFLAYFEKLKKSRSFVEILPNAGYPTGKPASCVAASRLCRHSAQTHTSYNASVLSRVYIWGILDVIRAKVVPGSGMVKEQAEEEGLDKVLIEAGMEWRYVFLTSS